MENNFKPLKPSIVLGVAAHPDDLDFGSSATMAKFAHDGAKIYYLILTDGGKGSEDANLTSEELTQIRRREQTAALKLIGGQEATFLDYPDSGLEITMDLKKDIVMEIRRLKPDVVVTMDPSVLYSQTRGFINHPDHRAAGQATLDAVFPLSRDHLTFPELYKNGLKPHKVKTILLTNFDRQNYYVDVTETLDLKWQAIKAHISQVKDFEQIQQNFMKFAELSGKKAGYKYAEGFMRLDVS